MNDVVYPVILTYEDDVIYISLPNFSDEKCLTYGETLEEAIKSAKEVLTLHLHDLFQEKKEFPKPLDIEKLEKNQEIKYITLNLDYQFPLVKNISNRFTKEKQNKLFYYLNNIKEDKVNLTLDEICSIIDSPLSKSAYTYTEYWSDRTRGIALNSWIKAGFFAKLDLENQSVEFYK